MNDPQGGQRPDHLSACSFRVPASASFVCICVQLHILTRIGSCYRTHTLRNMPTWKAWQRSPFQQGFFINYRLRSRHCSQTAAALLWLPRHSTSWMHLHLPLGPNLAWTPMTGSSTAKANPRTPLKAARQRCTDAVEQRVQRRIFPQLRLRSVRSLRVRQLTRCRSSRSPRICSKSLKNDPSTHGLTSLTAVEKGSA